MSVPTAIPEYSSNIPAEMFTGGQRINTLWYVSEVIVNHLMLQSIDSKDLRTAMAKLIDEVIEVSDLSTFAEEMMWTIARRYMGEDHGIDSIDEFEFADAPHLYDVPIPIFVNTARGEKAEATGPAESD